MQVDLPDTLNTMARAGADEDDDEGMHILSDIESQEAQRARDTTTTTTKKTRQQKPEWTEQLMKHLQENHALLERVLLPQPQTLRETFIRYVTDVLRNVSDEQYEELQVSINDTLQRTLSRRPGAIPPPQASTSTAPPQTSSSTAPPQTSTSTGPPQDTSSTTPLHQLTPMTMLRPFFSSPYYYGMDHPSQPLFQPSPSPMKLTTPSLTTPPDHQLTTPPDEQLPEDYS